MRRLLLVEDDAHIAKAFEILVRELVDVVHAPTLAAATQTLGTARWAGLVIDILLPDGSGLDALAYAREHGYRGPALVYTAYYDPDEINRAYALGAKYLVKPGTADDLREFVIRALRRRRPAPLDAWMKRYKLTRTELGILQAAVDGRSRAQIVAERGNAPATTKTHIHNLLHKTGDSSLVAAAARLLREARGRPLTRLPKADARGKRVS